MFAEVRCPEGWYAIGPHCATIVTVSPYTSCPGDKSQFRRGVRVEMQVAQAGICAVVENTSPLLRCSPGFEMKSTYLEPEEGKRERMVKGNKSRNNKSGMMGRRRLGKKKGEFQLLRKTFVCESNDIIPYPVGFHKTNSSS